MKNILQLLENTEKKYPNKIAFGESDKEITFKQLENDSKKIGTIISEILIKQNSTKAQYDDANEVAFNCGGSYCSSDVNKRSLSFSSEAEKKESKIMKQNDIIMNKPIVIFIDKTINCIKSMFGVLYSGNFYSIIDTKSPKERLQNILETLNPMMVITDTKNYDRFKKYDLDVSIPIINIDLLDGQINENILKKIRDKQIDTDIMYVLFTSGSTGIPKGTVLSHKAVISYIEWVTKTFKINTNTIWGSQTPFYFSMSITDVFSTIASGATLYIIPKMYFSFPIKLFEYLREKNVNTIYWVPSALCLVANFGTLKSKIEMPKLKKILFAGEVMPVKQLNTWIKKFPKAKFANLFGPTETTDICSYYIIDRKIDEGESIPIGKHCDNCDLLIIDENGKEIKCAEDGSGELYARGSFLASGYYNNMKKTKEAFIQNPLNKSYPEIIYKTGDIVKYNKNGELIYVSRKDYQIKKMGYRIELGEIENTIYGIDGILLCACVYDEKTSQIILFYQNDNSVDENEIIKKANNKLLPYMRPNKYVKLNKFPYNSNGKIDRKKLKYALRKEID